MALPIIVTDLGHGDQCKGATVDYLAATQPVTLVVRHNGGAQAGHNVVFDGRQHTFSQWGAATFRGVRTYLSRYMVIHPRGLMVEGDLLVTRGVRDPFELLYIDEGALVITPYDQEVNRAREAYRGSGAHGSCGIGVGETVKAALLDPTAAVTALDFMEGGSGLERKLYAAHQRMLYVLEEELKVGSSWEGASPGLMEPSSIKRTLKAWGNYRTRLQLAGLDYLRTHLQGAGVVVFEGAQGVGLDEWHGFHPHNTWSNTTSENAEALIRECGGPRPYRLGVVRAYCTRHGQGPLITEGAPFAAAAPEEPHNSDHGFQGRFRAGPADEVLTRYCIAATGGVDGIALSHLDQVPVYTAATDYVTGDGKALHRLPVTPRPADRMAYCEGRLKDVWHARYRKPVEGREAIIKTVGEALEVPVVLGAQGPAAVNRFDRGLREALSSRSESAQGD